MQKAIIVLTTALRVEKINLDAITTELDLLAESIFMDDRIRELKGRKEFTEQTIDECKRAIRVLETHAKKQKSETIPPHIDDVVEYMTEKKIINPKENAEKFYAHYKSNGWKVGRNHMKSWTSAITTWNLPKEAGTIAPVAPVKKSGERLSTRW